MSSYSPGQVRGAWFSLVEPTPLENPELVSVSEDALRLIGLKLEDTHHPEFAAYFSGNKSLRGSRPAAHCYCGHQFGHFSGQLGDGATMYLGEVVNEDNERWELQFKGAGTTPYSRTADGRKVLRSSIREFLCSEAMHALGIPTTRAATIVTSSSTVPRDILYNGNVRSERCAVITRIARSFLRFGSFEIFKEEDPVTGRSGPSSGLRGTMLPQLLDFVVESYFSELPSSSSASREERCDGMFKEIVMRTARLVAQWQCVGFCHGVLNTDNMSILGLTMDYGPFGFMGYFDPGFVCNSSDTGGRYSYEEQPRMCLWNLERFRESIEDYLGEDDNTWKDEVYWRTFHEEYITTMRGKLGLLTQHETDRELISQLFSVLAETRSDFTGTFQLLSSLLGRSVEDAAVVLVGQGMPLEELNKYYQSGIPDEQYVQMVSLARSNPTLLQMLGVDPGMLMKEAKRREERAEIETLTPEQLHSGRAKKWSQWIESYFARLELEDMGGSSGRRREIMEASNPKVVLHNYVAQRAIDQAEQGDYSGVDRVLALVTSPYSPIPAELLSFVTDGKPQVARDLSGSIVLPQPAGASHLAVS